MPAKKSTVKRYDMLAREAADRLGVHVETVKRMARDGRVQARKNISGYWVFAVDDLDALPIHGVTEKVA
jgi:predicted site-specific integrase-resolvase